jgi:hypothetical protein
LAAGPGLWDDRPVPAVYHSAVDLVTIDPQQMAVGQSHTVTIGDRHYRAVKHADGTIDIQSPAHYWHVPGWYLISLALPVLLWLAVITASLAATHRG